MKALLKLHLEPNVSFEDFIDILGPCVGTHTYQRLVISLNKLRSALDRMMSHKGNPDHEIIFNNQEFLKILVSEMFF